MISETLLLNTIDSVRVFVDIANTKDYPIYLKSGNIISDGKSIMSVFGLDLTKPVIMEADTTSGFDLIKQVEKFIYKK